MELFSLLQGTPGKGKCNIVLDLGKYRSARMCELAERSLGGWEDGIRPMRLTGVYVSTG